ncbi:CDK2-associated and cullin domain-containing protein 1-like [Acropora palmata]|uniref:CDK2-associated and cullin domain-containing protein 1-like n=1 Tax=Acropora palmata TaxID=6131 RepID=UPI003DA08359
MSTEGIEENSVLRQPRVTFVNDETFSAFYWPKLESAIVVILQQNPGQFIPISYEEMYSTVYKCVCQQYAEKMYNNLIEIVSDYLKRVSEELKVTPRDAYLEKFNFLLLQFFQAVNGIVAIFSYMNRFYVKTKLQSDLNKELFRIFTNIVTDNVTLFDIMEEVASRPFAVDPQMLMSIVKGLYSLNPEFSRHNPELFARFIPNLLPPTHWDQLPTLIQEDRMLQENLVTSQGFSRQDSGRKRRGEDFQGR